MRRSAIQSNAYQFLQQNLENAKTSASSSSNEGLNAARALIERGGNTAPGSQMPLTANGLLAGGLKEASEWLQSLKENNPDDHALYKIARTRTRDPDAYNRLSPEEKSRAMSLSRDYDDLYRSRRTLESASSSRPGSSKKEHPTTADSRRLPASTIARQEYIKQYTREWNSRYNPDAASESDDSP